MERYVDLEQISDGRKYRDNDLVKADCGGCVGCSSCCERMADTIILDPLDIYNLCKGLSVGFEDLMQGAVELNVQDGLIQPNLRMADPTGCCSFLENGRCKVHSFRPGFCRLFPLGRVYENGDFSYFLQVYECPYPKKQKIKVKKWINVAEPVKNRAFINSWHDLRVELKEAAQTLTGENEIRTLNLFFLRTFFQDPYDVEQDFYEQYEARAAKLRTVLGL